MWKVVYYEWYYMQASGKGIISISLEQGPTFNKIYFKDTATGIAKDILPHIFEKFYSKTQGGTGIGLAFCKRAMQEMGGDIDCNSIENEHTTFILSLPKL